MVWSRVSVRKMWCWTFDWLHFNLPDIWDIFPTHMNCVRNLLRAYSHGAPNDRDHFYVIVIHLIHDGDSSKKNMQMEDAMACILTEFQCALWRCLEQLSTCTCPQPTRLVTNSKNHLPMSVYYPPQWNNKPIYWSACRSLRERNGLLQTDSGTVVGRQIPNSSNQ